MSKPSPFRYLKTSRGIIGVAVMMYVRFPLSLRNVHEMFVKINGEQYYLWRAADHEGEVLESFVTKRREPRRQYDLNETRH